MREKTETNVINLFQKTQHLSTKGKMTLVVPLDETTPDFEKRLYTAMCLLFRAGDVAIKSINVPNIAGEQIVIYGIDIVNRQSGGDNWFEQLVGDTVPRPSPL